MRLHGGPKIPKAQCQRRKRNRVPRFSRTYSLAFVSPAAFRAGSTPLFDLDQGGPNVRLSYPARSSRFLHQDRQPRIIGRSAHPRAGTPRLPIAPHHCGDPRWQRARGSHGHRPRQSAALFLGRAGAACRIGVRSSAGLQRDACVFEKINYALVIADRERVGREASPSAAIIDSQSVKSTGAGGPRGYDAGKKIKGRKRHALVDTDGRGLLLQPHPASIQDRDSGGPLLQASRRLFPSIDRVFADGGYADERAVTATRIIVEIVAKNSDQVGCAVLLRRWVVERFFAWIGRNRRLAKDFDATTDSARAFLYAASVMLLSRRIAQAA